MIAPRTYLPKAFRERVRPSSVNKCRSFLMGTIPSFRQKRSFEKPSFQEGEMGGAGPRFLGRRNQTASRALEFRDGSLVQRFQDSYHCFSRISTDSVNKRRSSLACYFLFEEVASRVPFPSSSLHSRLRPQASCSVMCSFCAKRSFSFSSIFNRRYLVTHHTPRVSRSTSSNQVCMARKMGRGLVVLS